MNGACERVGTRLAEWISGELSAADRVEVREHLSTCPACRMEEAEMREMIALLADDAAAASGVRDPGDAYWAGFAARVTTRLPARERVAARSRAWSWLRLPQVATGLAAAAVLVIALNTSRPGGTSEPGGAADPELTALFEESMAPPSLDGIAGLADAELDRLGNELASADPPRGVAPAATIGTPARDADTIRSPAPFDGLGDLSPEELEALLEQLDAFET